MAQFTSPSQRQRGIFISHAYEDNGVCEGLEAKLKARGYEVWLDLEQEYAGKEISQVVRDALISHDVMLVVLSDAALASDWVRNEYAFFRDYENRGRRVVSVKVAECQLHAEPHLTLADPAQQRALELEDLAAIDATYLPLDETVSRIESQLNSRFSRLGRVSLTKLDPIDFELLIRDLLPAIYGVGSGASEVQPRFDAQVMIDVATTNSYTLFPGRYLIETKAWRQPTISAATARQLIMALIGKMQVAKTTEERDGVDQEVFGFLFIPSEIPRQLRIEARQSNVRIFSGQHLVSLLRDNGFDVEL